MLEEKTHPKEFYLALKQVDRVWNGEEGISLRQAERQGLVSDIEHIFIRNDDWSIACSEENLESCKELWDEQWEKQLTIQVPAQNKSS